MKLRTVIGVAGMAAVAGLAFSAWAMQPPTKTSGPFPKLNDPAKPDAEKVKKDTGVIHDSAAKAMGLKVGAKIPADLEVQNLSGGFSKLSVAYKNSPAIVVFYRGGWCPFCNKHLAAWQAKFEDAKKAGASLTFITPEKLADANKTLEGHKLAFPILVDSDATAAKAFDVAFRVDEPTQKKYEGFGVNLATRNANKEWWLPVPATFIIDREGTVVWSSVDPDYTKRADPDTVLAELKKLQGSAPIAPQAKSDLTPIDKK